MGGPRDRPPPKFKLWKPLNPKPHMSRVSPFEVTPHLSPYHAEITVNFCSGTLDLDLSVHISVRLTSQLQQVTPQLAETCLPVFMYCLSGSRVGMGEDLDSSSLQIFLLPQVNLFVCCQSIPTLWGYGVLTMSIAIIESHTCECKAVVRECMFWVVTRSSLLGIIIRALRSRVCSVELRISLELTVAGFAS